MLRISLISDDDSIEVETEDKKYEINRRSIAVNGVILVYAHEDYPEIYDKALESIVAEVEDVAENIVSALKLSIGVIQGEG